MHARNETESLVTQAVWAALLGYHVAEFGVEVMEVGEGVDIIARGPGEPVQFKIRRDSPIDVTTQIAHAARKIAAL